MAKHWIRDVPFNTGVTEDRGYLSAMAQMVFHMLRCAGYEWVWECDGHKGIALGAEPNHVEDGNMEAAGTANWTAAAGTPTISKDTSEYYSGAQSLKIIGASGDEIESAAITDPPQARSTAGGFADLGGSVIRFTKDASDAHDFNDKCVGDSITFSGADNVANDGTFVITNVNDSDSLDYTNASGVTDSSNASLTWYIRTPLHLTLWVNNPGTQTWNVDVDRGDGSPYNVGSFGATTGWELKHFDLTLVGNGNVSISIKPQGTSDTIYVDSVLLFRSFFEYTNDYEDYASGDAGAYVAQYASDEFESSNYTFVAGDVGKFLFLFDTTYPTNSGCYEITSINSGRAVLTLRSGTASLTTNSGTVNWRMVDIYKWMQNVGDYTETDNIVEVYSGFALESPHASGWRFVLRGLWTDGDATYRNGMVTWSAPEDTAIDVDTGNFFKTGPSIMSATAERNKTLQELNFAAAINAYNDSTGLSWLRSRGVPATFTARQFMMLEEDGSWFFVATIPDNASSTAGLFGLVGADAYHSGAQAHCHLCSRDSYMTGSGGVREFIEWSYEARWAINGRGIGPDNLPRKLQAIQYGYGVSNAHFWEQSNAQGNPFSNDEYIHPLLLARDPDGTAGNPSEREADGVYQGRANMTELSTFGNVNGSGDSFALSGSTITLTDAAAAFTSSMIGKEITITGATTGGNDGTFTVTGVPTSSTLTYENASGATEAFTGDWTVNMATYLHLRNGLCIDWMGETLV
jgi:hypothetical protein